VTSVQAIPAFTAAAALLTITPGLDTALVLRTAAVEGPRRAFLAGLGICLGCLAWGLAASAGLGALLVVSQVAFNVVRILGAGYLLYLGFRLIQRSSRRLGGSAARLAEVSTAEVSPRGWFLRGLLTNLLNPKVGVFYLTFLPQFVPADVSVTPFSMLLASIHAALGLVWFGFLIALTRPLSAWLARPAVVTTLDRATGLLLIGFGVRLVLSRSR
jgi:threonine/homoserine/homoserine lactone efflux protein